MRKTFAEFCNDRRKVLIYRDGDGRTLVTFLQHISKQSWRQVNIMHVKPGNTERIAFDAANFLSSLNSTKICQEISEISLATTF